MRAWRRQQREDRAPAPPLLPPSYALECGWCGEVRTRPLDSACPLCGGQWFRLARGNAQPEGPRPDPLGLRQIDKTGRHM